MEIYLQIKGKQNSPIFFLPIERKKRTFRTLYCKGRSWFCGFDTGFGLCWTTKAQCPLAKDTETGDAGQGELLVQRGCCVRTRNSSLFSSIKQVLVQEIGGGWVGFFYYYYYFFYVYKVCLFLLLN